MYIRYDESKIQCNNVYFIQACTNYHNASHEEVLFNSKIITIFVFLTLKYSPVKYKVNCNAKLKRLQDHNTE